MVVNPQITTVKAVTECLKKLNFNAVITFPKFISTHF